MDFVRMLVAALFAFLIAKAVGAAVDPAVSTERSSHRGASRLMVPCATCGVYVLKERAVTTPGRTVYCSAECSMVSGGRT